MMSLSDTGTALAGGLISLDYLGFIDFLKRTDNILVLTGAGTSVPSNIPDFRSKGGLYDHTNIKKYGLEYAEQLFEINYFRKNPVPFYELSKGLIPGEHQPNPAHFFIALLEKNNKLLRLYTQNVDCLDRVAGVSDERIVEAHGSYSEVYCLSCNERYRYEEYFSEFKKGEVCYCRKCKHGLIKPNIVFYGEELPSRFYDFLREDVKKAKMLIVMGTSLTVSPCCYIPGYVSKDVPRVLINRDNVGVDDEDVYREDHKLYFGMENSRDIFIQGELDEICLNIIENMDWTEQYDELVQISKSYYKDSKI